MSRPVWVEAALNGPWSRGLQPLIPVTADEIVEAGIAAAGEGAAILHFHAYDPVTGKQKDDADLYAPIIERLRRATGCIVYPTLPIAGSDLSGLGGTATERFRHIDALALRGLVEWAVVDPGSVNFACRSRAEGASSPFVYLNPDDHIREGLRLAAIHGFHPSYAIYEPGFTRLGALLSRELVVPTPIYRFMFSEQFAWGFPPEPWALEAHLRLLAVEAPTAPWMVAGLGVDIVPLVAEAVTRGGHVRAGLEDAPLGTRDANTAWVSRTVRAVVGAGGQPASPSDIRMALLSASPNPIVG